MTQAYLIHRKHINRPKSKLWPQMTLGDQIFWNFFTTLIWSLLNWLITKKVNFGHRKRSQDFLKFEPPRFIFENFQHSKFFHDYFWRCSITWCYQIFNTTSLKFDPYGCHNESAILIMGFPGFSTKFAIICAARSQQVPPPKKAQQVPPGYWNHM